jgi:CheY-like chemotaxis protein
MAIRLHILVAEDNPDCALSLAELLRLCGYQCVQVVSDGTSAIRAVGASEFDVVLLDLGLPIVDGWNVARQIRGMPLPRRPLNFAITGYGLAEDRQRSAAAGIDFHLLKPADPQELLNLLQAIATRNQKRSPSTPRALRRLPDHVKRSSGSFGQKPSGWSMDARRLDEPELQVRCTPLSRHTNEASTILQLERELQPI